MTSPEAAPSMADCMLWFATTTWLAAWAAEQANRKQRRKWMLLIIFMALF
jgi:hypothetical protein